MVINLQSTQNGIKLTNSDGKDLMSVLPKEIKSKINEQKNLQFTQSYDGVGEQILSHDVVSFDIFDTLIARKVYEPEMVFDLVGRFAERNGIAVHDFRRERIKAQLESGLSNANLDEIYDQLVINTNISKEQAELLKQKELKIERKVVTPRNDVVSLFYYALESQKRVYLTTDMYLNRRYIVSLLNKCGITGYHDIFDSCEYRKLKLEELFEELIASNPGRSILHIGDSYINDCICAEIAGIDSLLIPKGSEIAEKKKIKGTGQFSDISDKLMTGNLIAHTCNSPFPQGNMDHNKFWFEIGYSYIGPIVLSFAVWLLNNINLDLYDGILLSARDGYLLSKVLYALRERKILDDKLELHYFYTSRKSAVAMHTDDESTINLLVKRTGLFYLPDKMLREVFCMSDKDVKTYDFEHYGENRYQYVWDHYDKIKDNVYLLKRNFYRYLGREGIKTGGRYLMYDFVSSGTVHRALSTIVPFELDGVYYQFTGAEDFKGELYSRFPKDNQIIRECYKLMENLMLSPEPSLWGYDDNGKAIFCTEKRNETMLDISKTVHKSAMLFVDDCLDAFEPEDAMLSDEFILSLIKELKEKIRDRGIQELNDDWFLSEQQ